MRSEELTSSRLVQKVWQFAHVLKDDGLAFMDYTEQITYLLFLKMAWERKAQGPKIPPECSWDSLLVRAPQGELLSRYHAALQTLSEQPGLIGLIFTKPQSKINDPAKLRRLVELIDGEEWSSLDVDVKGAVYEGLLAKNAEDVRGGAGQYFTPRPVVEAIVEVMRPGLNMKIADPACGTGGFLIAAYEYLRCLSKGEHDNWRLHNKVLQGTDIVPNVARLCAMNLFLHGIGEGSQHPVVSIEDSLENRANQVDMVLTNPPFGKKSSFTVITEDGRKATRSIHYARKDFWATTSNKQLNFLQHTYSILRGGGRAAIVVPDNVLFEGGAGERVRRALLSSCHVHTLLRLPTGIWYSPSVKANVLFFEKPKRRSARRSNDLWVYDLRSRGKYSLKRRPITRQDLREFVASFSAKDRRKRKETSRFRRFSYAEIMEREKANLDIRWGNQDEEAGPASVDPTVIMREIVIDLSEAVREFAATETELTSQDKTDGKG